MSLEEDLKNFREGCPELFDNNRDVVIFKDFMCPISILEATVKEFVVDEYESAELVVLRLYDAGVKTYDSISALTGINTSLVKKLLESEMYSYGHIDPITLELTQAGIQTLKDNIDNNNVYQHALYEVKRKIQFEALTGTVIKPEAEKSSIQMKNYSEKMNPVLFPKGQITVDEELLSELNRNLKYYVDHNYLKDGNTIESFSTPKSREVKYREAYFVKMNGLKYPFIILPYYKNQKVKKKKILEPTAISLSDSKIIKYDKESGKRKYLVRDNYNFDYLLQYDEQFVLG